MEATRNETQKKIKQFLKRIIDEAMTQTSNGSFTEYRHNPKKGKNINQDELQSDKNVTKLIFLKRAKLLFASAFNRQDAAIYNLWATQ